MTASTENGPIDGLTTTRAAFIEQAQAAGELYIHQPYELYSEANQRTWQRLYAHLRPKWEKYANSKFMEGVENLMLQPDAIPVLSDINRFLSPLSGFKARAVSGYVPAYMFFDCLRNRSFPTTITIRGGEQLDYLPEPDIFHDIQGHIPLLMNKKYADFMWEIGVLGYEIVKNKRNLTPELVNHNLKRLQNFSWWTYEYGLLKNSGRTDKFRRVSNDIPYEIYGSGIISSLDETKNIINLWRSCLCEQSRSRTIF